MTDQSFDQIHDEIRSYLEGYIKQAHILAPVLRDLEAMRDAANSFALDKVLLANGNLTVSGYDFDYYLYGRQDGAFFREGNMLDDAVRMRARAECVAWLMKNREGS